MLLVTPRLVKPMGPEEITLPTDHYVEPSDYEFYLLGRLEGRQPAEAAPRGVSQLPTDVGPEESGGLIGDFGHRLPIPAPTGEGR